MSKGLKRSLSRGNPASAAAVQQASLRVKDLTLSVADGAPGFGTAVLAGLPEGNILVLGTVSYLQLTNTTTGTVTATFDGSMAIGTTPTADNTLSGTEVNIVPATSLGAATANVSPLVRGASTAPTAILDNTDGSLELNLNVTIADAAISGAGTFKVNGVVNIAYSVLGDD